MQETQILHLVRNGYALATPEQAQVVMTCPDLQVVEGRWVPRWALEAEVSLEDCGFSTEQLRTIFGHGKDRVVAELQAMVRGGKRARLFETRKRYQPSRIDLLTETALTGALRAHRRSCALCEGLQPCVEGGQLQEQLDLLFPLDRRKAKRI